MRTPSEWCFFAWSSFVCTCLNFEMNSWRLNETNILVFTEFCLKQIWYLNNIQRSPDDAISKSLNIKLTATLSLNSFFSMSSKISNALKNNWNLETKAIVQTFANNVNKIQWRRMHSSRMRTIHCSGHLWGGGVCLGVSAQGVSG